MLTVKTEECKLLIVLCTYKYTDIVSLFWICRNGGITSDMWIYPHGTTWHQQILHSPNFLLFLPPSLLNPYHRSLTWPNNSNRLWGGHVAAYREFTGVITFQFKNKIFSQSVNRWSWFVYLVLVQDLKFQKVPYFIMPSMYLSQLPTSTVSQNRDPEP